MNKTIILNKSMRDLKQGSKVKIKCDENGIPMDMFWRRRLRDSKIDNCIEIQEDVPRGTIKQNKSRLKKGDKS